MKGKLPETFLFWVRVYKSSANVPNEKSNGIRRKQKSSELSIEFAHYEEVDFFASGIVQERDNEAERYNPTPKTDSKEKEGKIMNGEDRAGR